MIVDNFKNLLLYKNTIPYAKECYDFLCAYQKAPLPIGRYAIDGERCFAMVQQYETVPHGEKLYESHLQYHDLQFVAAGTERMYWATLDALQVETPFRDGVDCAFYSGADACPVVLKAGGFAFFAPHDAHKPGCTADSADTKVTKIVFKIAAGLRKD